MKVCRLCPLGVSVKGGVMEFRLYSAAIASLMDMFIIADTRRKCSQRFESHSIIISVKFISTSGGLWLQSDVIVPVAGKSLLFLFSNYFAIFIFAFNYAIILGEGFACKIWCNNNYFVFESVCTLIILLILHVALLRTLKNDVSATGFQSFPMPHQYIDSLKSAVQVCWLFL